MRTVEDSALGPQLTTCRRRRDSRYDDHYESSSRYRNRSRDRDDDRHYRRDRRDRDYHDDRDHDRRSRSPRGGRGRGNGRERTRCVPFPKLHPTLINLNLGLAPLSLLRMNGIVAPYLCSSLLPV